MPGDAGDQVWDQAVVRITDETFVEGMAGLRWQLRALVIQGVRLVIADVDGLALLSSTAVAALLSAHRVCRARGGGVVIRHPSRKTLDMLRRTGLHRVFAIDEDRPPPLRTRAPDQVRTRSSERSRPGWKVAG